MATPTAVQPSKPLEYLVLDAGALIRGHGMNLYHKAKKVVTVPDVLDELRDSKSRDLLERLPFEIEVRMPSQSSINAVAQFAKKSGDFAAISKTDLRLIALTHMLELELNGKKYMNDLAGKVEIAPLAAQIAQMKASDSATKVEPETPVAAVSAPVTKAPVSKPIAWGSKSFAAVLGGTDTGVPVASGEIATDTAGSEQTEEQGEFGIEEEEEDEQSESEESSPESEEEGEDSDSEEGDEPNEFAEPPVERVEETSAPVGDNTSHFAGTAAASLDGIEEALRESGLTAEDNELDGKHIVSGFEEHCGCGGDAHEAHHHTDSATKPESAPAAPTAALAAVQRPVSSEPYQSRMIRPSGLASGTSAFASAAESQRLRLEDDGVGWVNSTNLLQQKGNIFAPTSGAKKAKSKSKSAAPRDPSSTISVSESVTAQSSIAPSATEGSTAATGATGATGATTKKKKPKKRPTKVACLTTDFSMQNVMLQMDLRVMSVDGLMVKSVRQWVLRCMGCFEVHYDMDRLFCRKCGGHHLSRVAASVDSGGKLKLHLKKNYHVDLQGTKYSLPAPGKQGRYQGELLLREDQLLHGIWKQKCVKIRKDIKSAFGEDVTSDVGMHINKGQSIKIGLGKQNPNAAKGRERRGKSKTHSVK